MLSLYIGEIYIIELFEVAANRVDGTFCAVGTIYWELLVWGDNRVCARFFLVYFEPESGEFLEYCFYGFGVMLSGHNLDYIYTVVDSQLCVIDFSALCAW